MIKINFIILLSCLIFLIVSCKSSKELPVSHNYNCEGIVHLSENGCPVFIEITNSSVEGISVGNNLFPVNLKDNYKKKGLKISFSATISRAKSPEGCLIDCVASVDSVRVVP